MSDNQQTALLLLGLFAAASLIYAAGSWWSTRSVVAALNTIDDRP